MLVVTLGQDDIKNDGAFVWIGSVARAIAEANGSANLLDAERKIFRRINSGVQHGLLNPLDPDTMEPLPLDDYGMGIVPFGELVEWGRNPAGGMSASQLFDFRRNEADHPSDRLAPNAAPEAAESASGEPVGKGGWRLKASIARAPGYRWPLYQVLRAAHLAGKPCPKARAVLDIWSENPPPEVQVMSDGVKYNDGLGNPKEANLKAIQQSIKNLLE